jgi:hypothetical protein
VTTTVAKVLADARNLLMSSTRSVFNVLSADIDNAVTTVTLSYTDTTLLPTVGSYIEIDLEIMLVVAMSSSQATVIRAFLGSAAAAHTNGTYVKVDPEFFDYVLLTHLNGELADLCSPANGLFQALSVDITYTAARDGYDLTSTTTVEDILDMRYAKPDARKRWPQAEGQLARGMPTTDFASGNAILITEGGHVGQSIRVFYKAPYGALALTSDTLESTGGMHAQAVDIPAIGVAIRATTGREVARNFISAQSDTRRADEVPAGAQNSAAAGMRQLRMSRVQAEAARLAARWPSFGRFS